MEDQRRYITNSRMREENRASQMQAMLEPAKERLKAYTPEELCRKAGIRFHAERQEFEVDSLGRTVMVHFPDYEICEKLEMWHHLTILQYMDTADGMPLTGRQIDLTQMKGGLSRGYGFDKDIKTMFERYFSQVTREEFCEGCRKLGGVIVPGKADVTAVIPYAPRFPVTVNFWEADEEFPASGKTLVDEAAEHYLTIEAAGGACSAVVQELHRVIQELRE